MLRYSRYVLGVDQQRVDRERLLKAADRILSAVQVELAELEQRQQYLGQLKHYVDPTSDQTLGPAFEFFFVAEWALEVLALNGKRYARERYLQHGGDRPLAICVGHAPKRAIRTLLDPADFDLADPSQANRIGWTGCFRVFEMSPRISGGRTWPPRWCPDCRPSSGRRQRVRDIRRAHARRVAHIEARRRRLAKDS